MGQGKAITNWRRGLTAFLLLCGQLLAEAYDVPQSSLSPRFAGYANELLAKARASHEADPSDFDKAWRFGKACFFAAEFATNKTRHVQLAETGIAVCRKAVGLRPDSSEANYYLAMNLGQLARNKMLGALPLVREMEDLFLKVADRKPSLDFGGPHRCLGLLYRDAPGWPISVGSHKKAREHLIKAREVAPDYPENIIVLLETWLKFHDRRRLKNDLPRLDPVLQAARRKLTGRPWEAYWDDWENRARSIKARARKLLGDD